MENYKSLFTSLQLEVYGFDHCGTPLALMRQYRVASDIVLLP